MTAYTIGIDIGGTNTQIGIIDSDGKCYKKVQFKTSKNKNIDVFVEQVCQAIEEISYGLKILGIGIGAPNGNYYTGTIDSPPNLAWEGQNPIVSLVKEKLAYPVLLTNDANAAAMGEMIYGSAKNMNDFITITLGTGLGSGIVANGKLIYGHDGMAGELGHTTVDYNGRLCTCGRKGCLETYVSASGIVRTAKEFLKHEKSILSPLNKIEAQDISKAALIGDPLAVKVFDFTAKILGRKLADTVAYTSPEAIFLFGGLVKSGDLLIKPTKQYFEENLLSNYKNKVKILKSGLNESDAAILGASALVWNELNKL